MPRAPLLDFVSLRSGFGGESRLGAPCLIWTDFDTLSFPTQVQTYHRGGGSSSHVRKSVTVTRLPILRPALNSDHDDDDDDGDYGDDGDHGDYGDGGDDDGVDLHGSWSATVDDQAVTVASALGASVTPDKVKDDISMAGKKNLLTMLLLAPVLSTPAHPLALDTKPSQHH